MCHSWGATARAHVQGNDVPDLENSWTDRAQTWYIDRDRLVGWRGKVNSDLPCTCARWRFQISRTAWPIALKFGTRLGTGYQGAVHKLVGGNPSQFRTCKAHYLARSVGRPKRRYTGILKLLIVNIAHLQMRIALLSADHHGAFLSLLILHSVIIMGKVGKCKDFFLLTPNSQTVRGSRQLFGFNLSTCLDSHTVSNFAV